MEPNNHPEPYNPYATRPGARQTNESIPQFIQRLPPAQAEYTVPPHLFPPWYWIANPHRSAYSTGRAENGDVRSFTHHGHLLLEEYRQTLAKCAPNDPLRTLLPELLRDRIGEIPSITALPAARQKWMLFPEVHEVNDVWRAVCEGVDANWLGIGAKVSTWSRKEGDPARLICVYTRDFTDVEDVKRVLFALVNMGLVRPDGMPRDVMYKCDAYTHLGIYGENEYGLRASVYSSREMLAGS